MFRDAVNLCVKVIRRLRKNLLVPLQNQGTAYRLASSVAMSISRRPICVDNQVWGGGQLVAHVWRLRERANRMSQWPNR